MWNLYRLNSTFEFILANYPNFYKPKHPVIYRRFLDLEYLFLFLANSNDFVLISEEPDSEIIEIWKSKKFNFGTPIINPNHLFQYDFNLKNAENYNLIEWGNLSEIKKEKLILSKQKILEAKKLNSKFEQYQFKFEKKYISNLKIISSEKELIELLEELNFPAVFKKEFSFSGNGNSVFQDQTEFYSNKGFQRIKNILKNQNLIIEEWRINKTEEFSFLFNGSEFLSKTKMEVSNTGEFLGIELVNSEKSNFNFVDQYLKEQKINYNTYYSVDGYSYLDNKFEVQENFFSEINFRYSMGILLYLINQKLNHNFKLRYIQKIDYTLNKENYIPLTPYSIGKKNFALEF